MDNRNLGNQYHRWIKSARRADRLLVATIRQSLSASVTTGFGEHNLPCIDRGADAILSAVRDAQPTFNGGSGNNRHSV